MDKEALIISRERIKAKKDSRYDHQFLELIDILLAAIHTESIKTPPVSNNSGGHNLPELHYQLFCAFKPTIYPIKHTAYGLADIACRIFAEQSISKDASLSSDLPEVRGVDACSTETAAVVSTAPPDQDSRCPFIVSSDEGTSYCRLAQENGAMPKQDINAELLGLLTQMYECFKGCPQYVSMGLDSPPEPASKWDHNAGFLLSEVNKAIAAAQKGTV